METMDRILATHPYVAHVFVYEPNGKLTFRSQPSRLKDAPFRAESDGLSSMTSGWMQVEYKDQEKELEEMSKKGKPYYFFANWAPRGEKHLYQSGAVFLVGDAWGGHKAIGGMVFDAEYLRDQFFPEMLDSLLSHQEERGEKNHVAMMVHPKHEATPLVDFVGLGWWRTRSGAQPGRRVPRLDAGY